MGVMDHWHPVLLSRELRKKPVTLRLHGRGIVVFRTRDAGIGALVSECPHRGMHLGGGWVEGDRLVCPYHGWSYRPDGEGHSPGNPNLKARAGCFDAVELSGAIWLKAQGAAAEFPRPDFDGYHSIGTLRHRIDAPLEVVLDNFIEVEHTATTHAFLGYERDQMANVSTQVETSDGSVRVVNRGPQKRLPLPLSLAFGIRAGDDFIDDWTTWFSPVYSVYDQWWADPRTNEPRKQRLRVAVFFTPAEAEVTDLFTFAWSSEPPWGRLGINFLLKPLARALVDLEVRLDKRMIERLGESGRELGGRPLGRFDMALLEARRRVDRVYRGVTPLARPRP